MQNRKFKYSSFTFNISGYKFHNLKPPQYHIIKITSFEKPNLYMHAYSKKIVHDRTMKEV